MTVRFFRPRQAARAAVVLACALSPAAIAPQPAMADCEATGGLLTTITGELCTVTTGLTHGVTGGLDKATGDTLDPVTDGVDDTGEGLGEGVGKVGSAVDGSPKPTPKPSPSNPEFPGVPPCVPGLLSSPCTPDSDGGGPDPETPPGERPPGKDSPSEPDDNDAALPGRSDPTDTPPTRPQASVVPDDPPIGVPFLWPGHTLEGIPSPDRARAGGPVADPAEGALMAALVLMAVLAARIVSVRRNRRGIHRTMPFEPV